MAIYTIKRKLYTRYDDTDNLKRMKDSDILAEQKKEAPGYGDVVSKTAGGAIVGGLAAGIAGGLKSKSLAGASKYGKLGAMGVGLGAGLMALNKRDKEAADRNFYNKRLAYAQKQAKRREKIDWKSNMTQRDGYSY